MKKKLLVLLPLLVLTSCGRSGGGMAAHVRVITMDGLPAVVHGQATHTTYLMMSPFGSLNIDGAPVKGAVSELFYENTIVWVADPGSALPTKEQVVSSVSGATFRGWAYYDEENDNVFPEYYTVVPTKTLALKAIFDGTDAGGNSGQGGTSSSEQSESAYGIIFGDGTKVRATPAGKDPTGQKDQYAIYNQSFVAEQTFSLYNFNEDTSWIINIDGASFDSNVSSYVTVSGSVWHVEQNFTADVYIKLKFNEDEIYFGLK